MATMCQHEGYSTEQDRRVLCSCKPWTLGAKRQKTSRQKKKKMSDKHAG